MTVEYVWMEHEITHGRQVLPNIEFWRANGWNPCDGPPPERDLTKDLPEALPDAVGLFAAPEEVAVTSAPSDEQEDDDNA